MSDQMVEPKDARPVAEVVLFKHPDRVFHYSVPEDFRDRLEPGMRVLVPFRNRWTTGIVTRRPHRADPAQLKPILNLLDSIPLLDRSMMALARWVAEYYMTGWGVAMKAILPPGLEVKVGSHYRITAAGQKAVSESPRKGDPAQGILAILEQSPRGVRLEALQRRRAAGESSPSGDTGRLSRTLSVLVRKGWVDETNVLPRPRVSQTPVVPSPTTVRFPDGPMPTASSLPEDLYQAAGSGRFETVCLEGTPERSRPEVLALISTAVRRKRSVILLVPEIDRVAGWAERLENGLAETVGILHSGLSERDRRLQWERARRGDVSIVIGTRLAVFAPVLNPGLIVVEEEQDPAYKQPESPRYHARDVAVLRGAHHGALVLLTSTSPSVETYANIQSGKYRTVRLDGQRFELAMSPAVRIIGMGGQSRGTFVSRELLAAVTERMDKREPVVLLLNRRGFGGALCCRDCGAVVRCPRCHVAMVYSKQSRQLTCHYCGTVTAPPPVCLQCRGTRLEIIGAGTEQAEEFFQAKFPSARIARLDRDTVRSDEVSSAIGRLNRTELDMVIGTQLLLTGPRVTRPGLIGLLQSDGAFQLPDFRAGEQTFQLVRRVLNFSAGGEVILQTYHPAHEAIAWATTGDPREFYEKELAQRKALGYPPFARLAVVTVKSLNESRARAVAQRLGDEMMRTVRLDASQPAIQILGPAAAMRPRLHGKVRCQILIKAPNSRILHEALRAGLSAVRSGSDRARVWFEVDVDPQRIA
jgi:primosomal protein N' (replication factor Y)